jgi:hypothetical protein
MTLQGKMKEAREIMLGLEYPVRTDKADDVQFLTIGTKSKYFLLQTRYTIREDEDEIYAIAQVPFKIPEEMLPAAYVVVNEINSKIAVGCFFLSVDMRCVFFRASFPYFDGLNAKVIEKLTALIAKTIDKQMRKFGETFLFDKAFSLSEIQKQQSKKEKSDGMPQLSPSRPSGVTLH